VTAKFADLVEQNGGATYVIFGKENWAGFPSLDLSDLDGTIGFRLDGASKNDYSGFSVSSAGDVNGDGFDDILVGAYKADPDGATDAGASL
jgi:hypothetical protein